MAYEDRKIRTRCDEGHPSLGLEEALVLASNVERLRNHEQCSQEKLALVAGLSRPTISRIENGHPNARLSDIRKIADALGTTVIELLTPQSCS